MFYYLFLMTGHHEEVPSSEASVSVTEFISSDLLPPLPHGMSSQFMFPSEGCSPGEAGAIAPPPGALVTIQPDKGPVDGTSYSSPAGPGAGQQRVVSVSVQDSGHSPTTPTHCRQTNDDTEPQDLCGGSAGRHIYY